MIGLLSTQISHLHYVVSHCPPPAPKKNSVSSMTAARAAKMLEDKKEITAKVITHLEKYGESGSVQVADGIGHDRSALLKRLYVMEEEGLILRKKMRHGFSWRLV